jgi:putative PEP-CTERM system histidine kinase
MSLNVILHLLAIPLCVSLACLALLRSPKAFPHRIFALAMVLLGVEALLTGLSAQTISPERALLWQRLRWIAAAMVPGTWMLFSLSFPQGGKTPALGHWKWGILSAYLVPLPFVTLFSSHFFNGIGLSDATGGWFLQIGWAGYFFTICTLVSVVLTMMLLEKSLRAATGRKRWQVKFPALGLIALLGARVFTGSQVLLLHGVDLEIEVLNVGALLVATVLILLGLLRARFLHIDIYLSETALYRSFTLLMVGLYLLAVAVLAKALSHFAGTQALTFQILLVFLAFVGLAALILSDRVRLLTKQYISRHFKRPHYDYRKAWLAFTERTASLLDEKALCNAVVKIVAEMCDTLSITLWLTQTTQDTFRFGASTSVSETQARDFLAHAGGSALLWRITYSDQRIIDLADPKVRLALQIGESETRAIEQARIRYSLPLMIKREPLGILTLGDRVSGTPISSEESDLLSTIAYQTAASLWNLSLTERLNEAREMEAFHKVAATFVHDLKNMAAKLSLLIQNLPLHFDNPEFRQDALKAIGQTVLGIDRMCSRVSLAERSADIRLTEVDLNELVSSTLSGLEVFTNGCLVTNLQPLPKLLLDPEQMRKVITNLVMNASEATGGTGEVLVETGSCDGCWAIITVTDDGCGMSQEFLDQDLFRPFRTTKKHGTGIGLFHSKMIVDAHQGKIEVRSAEGKGTACSVLLPTERRQRQEK